MIKYIILIKIAIAVFLIVLSSWLYLDNVNLKKTLNRQIMESEMDLREKQDILIVCEKRIEDMKMRGEIVVQFLNIYGYKQYGGPKRIFISDDQINRASNIRKRLKMKLNIDVNDDNDNIEYLIEKILTN